MYPRNAASPERFSIGAVVQISDGAVQTSGVSVSVKPQGAAASAGAGTISYEQGIVAYLPTQAETDYTSFQVIAYKTGCIPASVTIVTSAAATAGQVVLAGVTHTGAVIPTISALTGHTPQTGDAFARLGAPAGASVSADVAAAKADTAAIKTKTDFLPSATAGAAGGLFIAGSNAATTVNFTGNLSGSVGSVTGAVGSVTGSVGSVAAGGITASSIAADAIGASELAADAVAEISSAVWAETTRVLTAGTNIVLAKGAGVTGFNDLSAAAINAEVDTAISDAALATAANLAIVAGYIDTEVAAIKAKTDNLPANPAAVSDIPTAAAVADQVWDEVLSGHAGVGSTGAALSAAGGSGDPWATALPGAYGAGTAGHTVGTYIDAAISGISGGGLDAAGVRAAVGLASANLDTQLAGKATAAALATAQADLDTITGADGVTLAAEQALYAPNKIAPLDAAATRAAVGLAAANLDTQLNAVATAAALALVKAKTDSLTFTVAGVVDANTRRINGTAITGNGQPGTEFGV